MAKYPEQTTTAIPAYTTATRSISMPEIPVTTIDWDNMLDDYSGSSTTAQKNAVAKLMLLCGQSLGMDYTSYESGANTVACAKSLRQYFGYDNVIEMGIYDADLHYLYSVTKNLTLAAGQSTTLSFESEQLEDSKSYAIVFWYQQNSETNTWVYNNTLYRFTVHVPVPTGLAAVAGGIRPFNVYTTTGCEVRHQVTTLKGLPTGIYVVNGRKVVVK